MKKGSKKSSNVKKYALIGAGIVLVIILAISVYYLKARSDVRAGEVLDCGDSTVIYLDEKLCWQQSANSKVTNWAEAESYCNSLTVGENDDWRLPTLFELGSIVDKSYETISINDTVFRDTEAKHYWSSTAYEFKDQAHWYVHFEIGHQAYALDFSKNYGVRCVRDNLLL